MNSGDQILPSQHNPAFNDVAQAITNSLDRNGSGGMRAPLDMGSQPIQNVAQGSLPTDAATVSQTLGNGVPIGTVLDWAGTVAPTGYMLCFGQSVSRTNYEPLFAVIGYYYGGDGANNFNIPDLRGRVTAGKDDMGGTPASRLQNPSEGITGSVLGAGFGAQSTTLTTAQIPSHSHGVTDPGHTHNYTVVSPTGGIASGSGYGQGNANTGVSGTGISIQNTGGGGAHNNVQPTTVLNKIIKVSNL